MRVIANSVPKSGTNLIKTLLENLPFLNRCRDYHLDMRCKDIARQIDHIRSGQFVRSHIPYDPLLSARIYESGVKNIFMIRNSRDIVVSTAHYIVNGDKNHRLTKYMRGLSSFDKVISACIRGVDSPYGLGSRASPSIREHLDLYTGWLTAKNCKIIKFEDLIGVKGGGSLGSQHRCLQEILLHLEVHLSQEEISFLCTKVFSSSSRNFEKE